MRLLVLFTNEMISLFQEVFRNLSRGGVYNLLYLEKLHSPHPFGPEKV